MNIYEEKSTILGELKPGDKFCFDGGEIEPYEVIKNKKESVLVIKPSGRKDWFNASNEVYKWKYKRKEKPNWQRIYP